MMKLETFTKKVNANTYELPKETKPKLLDFNTLLSTPQYQNKTVQELRTMVNKSTKEHNSWHQVRNTQKQKLEKQYKTDFASVLVHELGYTQEKALKFVNVLHGTFKVTNHTEQLKELTMFVTLSKLK